MNDVADRRAAAWPWLVLLAVLGPAPAAAQDSRPLLATRPQWSRDGDALKIEVSPEGHESVSHVLTPAAQWQDVLPNLGPVGLLLLLFPGSRELAAAGDPALYLDCFHERLTRVELAELLEPPANGEPRMRAIDRIAALGVVQLDARKDLEASVAALCKKDVSATLDSFTRAAAERALAALRATPAMAPPLSADAQAAALAALPDWSEILISVDETRAPELRRCVQPMRALGLAFVESAMRHAQGAVQPAQIAYALAVKGIGAAPYPLLVAWAGHARITRLHLGARLDASGGRPGRVPLSGMALSCALEGLFERDAFASYAKRIAETGVQVATEGGFAKLTCGPAAPPADRAGAFELRIGETQALACNRATATALGKERAAATVVRWRERVPGANALWAEARLPDGQLLDVGVTAGPRELRIEATLECGDEAAARRLLAQVEAALAPAPRDAPVDAGLRAKEAALQVVGKPKLAVEGKVVRAVLARERPLEELVAAWADALAQKVRADQ